MRLDRFLTVDDFKRAAERRVPRMFFQYADSGAYTESSYRANSEDFSRIRIEPRFSGMARAVSRFKRRCSKP